MTSNTSMLPVFRNGAHGVVAMWIRVDSIIRIEDPDTEDGIDYQIVSYWHGNHVEVVYASVPDLSSIFEMADHAKTPSSWPPYLPD